VRTLEAGSALRLLAAEVGGGGGGDGEGDAKAEKRAARSTRCGSDGKAGAGAGGGAAPGSRSSMAWEVGSPRSAVNVPPEEAEAADAGGARAWISPPAAGRSGVGEERRIGAARRRRGRRRREPVAEMGRRGGGEIVAVFLFIVESVFRGCLPRSPLGSLLRFFGSW
jgi:hypothetical protein